MYLGVVSVLLAQQPLAQALAHFKSLGLEAVEITAGGIWPRIHCDAKDMMADQASRESFLQTVEESGLKVSALAMHGEPLSPDKNKADTYEQEFTAACQLAKMMGVDRLTCIAGLPEGAPGDQSPNWITFPFPFDMPARYEYQWKERAIPTWKHLANIADEHGIKICIEPVPSDLVYNVETLLRLREAVGPTIGCNYDASHFFFQGIDPIEAIHELGDAIYHAHAKDAQIVTRNSKTNGTLDPKSFANPAKRGWLYRTVGFGHGEQFWRDFVSALRMVGYDDVVSIEHEDVLIDNEEGFALAVANLQNVLPKKPVGEQWFGDQY